ncbi:MAG: RNA polymerase sigma factor [Polyangiaceae bacterium]|nr:RNA polymerase sigma factor [Polyangiaceae bacterium]
MIIGLARAKRPKAPAAAAERRPSFQAILAETAPMAWRALRRLGVRDADVDDVLQEVFVTVHRKLATFEGRSAVRTWVYGICVRVAADYRKQARRRRDVTVPHPPEATTEPGQEHAASVREAMVVLDRLLDRIDDDKRAVFVLYEIEELTMAEVAAAVGCPVQTAYSRLHAARRELEAAAAPFRAHGGPR